MDIKWGLIGAGDIASKRVAPAIKQLEGNNLVAISRRDEIKGKAFAEEYDAEYIQDWKKLVAIDDIDIVYIATPVYLHAEQTIASAKNSKHVLCEKPMAINQIECIQMIKECEKNNVQLGVAYYRHFYPIIIRIKELIKKDEIGKPLIAQINAFMKFDRKPGEPRYWLLEKEKSGGGPMMDFGCHRLEIFNNLFGPAKKVIGTTHNLHYNRGVEDTATATIKYKDNVLASLIVTHAAMEPQDTLYIYGTKGSLHIPVLEYGQMSIITEKGKRMETHPADINVHYPCIENFVNSVIRDKPPVVNGQIGLHITRTLDKIYEKSRSEKI